ncbi:MAG: hypothetical protein ACI4EG_07000 [Fusicatenibacter sp.]|nr:hypothetical protein [Fusicatenibacter sp.]
MSSERIKKEMKDAAIMGERALTSLLYVQVTLYAAKSQKICSMTGNGSGRAMLRHTGIHMNAYIRTAGQDLNQFREQLHITHVPSQLQPKVGKFMMVTAHPFEEVHGKRMCPEDVTRLEKKVEDMISCTTEILRGLRELGVY